jgi:hypothetical protein
MDITAALLVLDGILKAAKTVSDIVAQANAEKRDLTPEEIDAVDAARAAVNKRADEAGI